MVTHWWACDGTYVCEVIENEAPPLLKVTLALIESADSVNVVNVMSGSFYEYFLIYHFMISAETFINFSFQMKRLNTHPNIFLTHNTNIRLSS